MTTDTRTRILDATLRAASRLGLARLSMDDVAREAGLSRQAVYYHFASRDELIAATILREEQAFLDGMVRETRDHTELEDALRAAIRAALVAAREHPLLDRLLATEPEVLLPFLTTGRGPVLSAAEGVVRQLLASWAPHLDQRQLHRTAEAATRLIVSYAISPPEGDIDEVAADLAELIAHGVAARSAAVESS